MLAATKIFASNFNAKMAQRFYNIFLLVRIIFVAGHIHLVRGCVAGVSALRFSRGMLVRLLYQKQDEER